MVMLMRDLLKINLEKNCHVLCLAEERKTFLNALSWFKCKLVELVN